jgi:hypothetical protein
MAEWSEDHVAAIGFLNSNLVYFGSSCLNWRPNGALRWKGEAIGWEGWRVACGKLACSRL